MALHNHSRMDRLENFVENLKLQFSQRDDRGSKNNLMDGTSLNDDESGEIQPPMMRTSLVSHTRERPKSTYFKSSFERRPSLHSNRGGRGGQSGKGSHGRGRGATSNSLHHESQVEIYKIFLIVLVLLTC